MDPYAVKIDLESGKMLDPAKRLVRRASDMRGHYADEAALKRLIAEQGDPLHYEVQEMSVPEEYGHLLYCISRLEPGTVGEECFMTKGHYHTIPETAEVYFCLRGHGYMLMKTTDGRCEAVEMAPGRLVYVPPYWAHRSVNTGDETLVSLCAYQGDAGHNYGDIEEEGFPKRIYRVDGQVEIR